MRIVAGSRKGHRISAPAGITTRPTSDRVRENVFNIVAPWIVDAEVLDLFAGSGAMGLEALSRGARRAVLVEGDDRACKTIEANLEKLRLTGAELVCRDVGTFVASDTRHFDLIFCDPPYDEYPRFEPILARYAPRLLAEDGLLVLETSARAAEPDLPLTKRTTRRYGSARITLFEQ